MFLKKKKDLGFLLLSSEVVSTTVLPTKINTFANTVDSDATAHLDLHCLPSVFDFD